MADEKKVLMDTITNNIGKPLMDYDIHPIHDDTHHLIYLEAYTGTTPYVYAGADNKICYMTGSPGNYIYHSYSLSGVSTGYTILWWTTNGTGVFSGETTLNAIYYPSEEDASIGFATLTLYSANQFGISNDSLILLIDTIPYIPETPYGLTGICYTTISATTYNSTGSSNALGYYWQLSPSSAGTYNSGYTSCENMVIYWSETFEGYCYLKIQGKNDCGYGEWSNELEIYVYCENP